MTTRMLPVLDLAPTRAQPGRATIETAPELAEFVTDDLALPRFHVWTLGCQMNHSDSEEMAGALAAAGCAEATDLESADLIVINSCAIREAAEQKVIGRMGHLANLRAANPALRVVLTGCSVRADNTAALHKRYPQVDLFLRPDEEPELTSRLGLAGATAPGLLAARAAAVGEGRIERRSATVSLAADHLRLRQDVHLLHRAVQPRTGGQPPVRRRARRGARRWPRRVTARSRCSARTSTRTATTCRPRRVLPTSIPGGISGAGWSSTASRTWPRCCARSIRCAPPMACPPSRASASLRRIRGTCRIGSSPPWPNANRCASTCTCRSSRATTPCCAEWAASTPSTSYLELVERLRAAVPGISLTTDVIVGFCGETEAQFENTLEMLRKVRFETVFAAAFSPRPGTPAARLVDDVPRAEKKRRLQALLDLQEEHRFRGQPGLVGSDNRGPRRPAAARGRATTATGRGLAWPAATATTSSSISTALPSSSGVWWTSKSTTPARTRCPGRSTPEQGFRRSSSSRARRQPARRACRFVSPSRYRARRSSAPIRARSIAAWISARPR